jgi:rubrerythrin
MPTGTERLDYSSERLNMFTGQSQIRHAVTPAILAGGTGYGRTILSRGGGSMKIEEAIKTAIAYELKIRDIYREAEAAVSDDIGKRIFATLGEDEQHHIDYLHHKLEQWRTSGKLVPESLDSAVPSREIVQQEAAKVKPLISQDFHGVRQQMLSKALKLEIETSDFYRKMVAELPTEGQEMFQRFLEIENNHIQAVQFELDYLGKTGYWFDFKEFDME